MQAYAPLEQHQMSMPMILLTSMCHEPDPTPAPLLARALFQSMHGCGLVKREAQTRCTFVAMPGAKAVKSFAESAQRMALSCIAKEQIL